MLMASFAVLTGSGSGASPAENSLAALTPRAPIRIDSNSDFDAAHGVTGGSGTASDPYIIENYEINGTGYGYCIYVGNTTSYFTIRNCYLHDAVGNNGMYRGNTAIFTLFADNGRIINNTVQTSEVGVDVIMSNNYYIINNTFSENMQHGVYIYSSKVTLINNTASHNLYSGIHFEGSSYGTLDGNKLLDNGNGIEFSSSSNNNNIINNTVSNNTKGIYMDYSSYNTISNNTLLYNRDGIFFSGCESNTLRYNNMTHNGIFMYGDTLSQWDTHIIDLTNTVNGKPVYYWKDRDGGTIPSDAGQVILANCKNITVENLQLTNGSTGIELGFSSSNIIKNNTLSYSHHGMYLYNGNENEIFNNSALNNTGYGLWANTFDYNTISNNTLSGNLRGIEVGSSSNNNITNNTASHNKYGISLYSSSENNIIGNTLLDNVYGLNISFSDKANYISRNLISKNDDGIDVYVSSYDLISNNTISENENHGIHLCQHSSSLSVRNNTISDNVKTGIYITSSTSNTVSGNTMEQDGIFISGNDISHWNSHNIDITNTVNGKPVYYWKNIAGGAVPGDAGEVILANCTGVVVEKQDLSNGTVGIELGFSSNNTLANSTTSNGTYGIYLSFSENNTVYGNNISNNAKNGITLSNSANNTLTNNTMNMDSIFIVGDSLEHWNSQNIDTSNTVNGMPVYYWKNATGGKVPAGAGEIILSNCSLVSIEGQRLTNGSAGIEIGFSSNITVFNNTLSFNTNYGIFIYSSTGSNIYHNNLITNANQAYDSGKDNQWNASYPEGGNYWSDYDGIDTYSGPYQNISGSDGVGDTPYTEIGTSGARDNYPLMFPTGTNISDTTPPTILSTVPADSSVNVSVSAGTYAIQFNETMDTSIGISGNITTNLPSPVWSWSSDGIWLNATYGPLQYGTVYYVNLSANFTDLAGNSLSGDRDKSFTTVFDTTPPVVSISYPSSGAIFDTSTVTVFWNGSDAGTGMDHYELSLDNGSWLNVGGALSHEFTNLSDGVHTVSVKAFDSAGNTATSSVTFTVNTTATDTDVPVVAITSPADGDLINDTSVTVTWEGSDNGSGINHYEIRVDNGSWVDVGTEVTYTLANLSDGDHTITVRAVDNSSNEATDSVSITVDATAPIVAIISPADNLLMNTSSVTVTWSGTDETTGIDRYEVRLDNGSWVDTHSDTNRLFVNISDGEHIITLKGVDCAGNEATDSVSFYVDTTAPSVIAFSPSGDNTSLDSSISVTFSESMNRSSVAVSVEGLSGNLSWDGNTVVFIPEGNLTADTKYVVSVSGKDLAGNALSPYSWNFTTASQNGSVTPIQTPTTGNISGVVTDENGDPVSGATVSVQGTDITAITDSTGHFVLVNVSAGQQTIVISRSGFNDSTAVVTVTEGTTTTINPVLHPLASQPPAASEFPWWIVILGLLVAAIILGLLVRKRGGAAPVEMNEKSETEADGDAKEETEPPEKDEPVENKLSNEQIIENIEKAYKEGRMSEEMYRKNMEKFGVNGD